MYKNAWSTHTATRRCSWPARLRENSPRSMPRHDPLAGGLYFTNPDRRSTHAPGGAFEARRVRRQRRRHRATLDDLDGVRLRRHATHFDQILFTMTAPNPPGPVNASVRRGRFSRRPGKATSITIDFDGVEINAARTARRVVAATFTVEKIDPNDLFSHIRQRLRWEAAIAGGFIARSSDFPGARDGDRSCTRAPCDLRTRTRDHVEVSVDRARVNGNAVARVPRRGLGGCPIDASRHTTLTPRPHGHTPARTPRAPERSTSTPAHPAPARRRPACSR